MRRRWGLLEQSYYIPSSLKSVIDLSTNCLVGRPEKRICVNDETGTRPKSIGALSRCRALGLAAPDILTYTPRGAKEHD